MKSTHLSLSKYVRSLLMVKTAVGYIRWLYLVKSRCMRFCRYHELFKRRTWPLKGILLVLTFFISGSEAKQIGYFFGVIHDKQILLPGNQMRETNNALTDPDGTQHKILLVRKHVMTICFLQIPSQTCTQTRSGTNMRGLTGTGNADSRS